MSQVLNIHEHLKYKSAITFSSEGCLSYIHKQNCREVLITFSIPYEVLIRWHQIKVVKKLAVSYVELFYLSQSIAGCFFINEEAKVRIEKRLSELCSSAFRSCVGVHGGKRVQLLQKVKKLAVHRHEIEDVDNILSQIKILEEEKGQLEEQIKGLEARCDTLLNDVLEFRNNADRLVDLEQSFSDVDNQNQELNDQNDELHHYIRTLIDRDSCKHCDSTYKNKGKTYENVSSTQQQRKLKQLKTNAEKALWFLESFGFKLEKIALVPSSSGARVDMDYSNTTRSAYQLLSENDQDKIKNVLYIMDKFCVSDAAYHEFTMTDHEGLPRSYLIKQCRHNLNQFYHISRTPGEWPGAQLTFKDELHHQLSKKVNFKLCF